MRRVLHWFETLDRRWIFLAMLLAVLLPLFRPIGLPITPSKEAIAFYQTIEALPDGSTVYLAADYDPGSSAELQPMLMVAVRQLCGKNIKIIAACLWPAGPPLVDQVLREIAVNEFKKVDGVDFVNLGFKEGREVVMVQLGHSLRAVYPSDSRGRPADQLPILRGIESLRDLPLIVSISAGYPGTKEWVQQVRSRFSLPIVAGCTAVSAPEYYPYYQSGQLSGLLGGLAGAAEYEKQLGQSGKATQGMDAQSLGHLAVILFIVVGNIVHLVRRRAPGGQP